MYRVSDALAGRNATCKNCGRSMQIPGEPPADASADVESDTPPADAPPISAAAEDDFPTAYPVRSGRPGQTGRPPATAAGAAEGGLFAGDRPATPATPSRAAGPSAPPDSPPRRISAPRRTPPSPRRPAPAAETPDDALDLPIARPARVSAAAGASKRTSAGPARPARTGLFLAIGAGLVAVVAIVWGTSVWLDSGDSEPVETADTTEAPPAELARATDPTKALVPPVGPRPTPIAPPRAPAPVEPTPKPPAPVVPTPRPPAPVEPLSGTPSPLGPAPGPAKPVPVPPVAPPAPARPPAALPAAAADPDAFCSPLEVAYRGDGRVLAVSDHSARAVAFIDLSAGPAKARLLGRVNLAGKPAGLAWSADGTALFAAESDLGTVAQIDPTTGKVTRRLLTGYRGSGLALAPKHKLLLAANTATNLLAVCSLDTGEVKAHVPMPKWPAVVAVTPDETLAVVGNFFPAGSSLDENAAAAVSLVDLATLKRVLDIPLPAGSAMLRDVVISPDGRWAYVSHTLGRTNLPTTQLDRGWVNTNAVSIIDLRARAYYASMLLDRPTDGAADPWGLALSDAGQTLHVALSGRHELARVNLADLHKLLGTEALSKADVEKYRAHPGSIWQRIRTDEKQRTQLANDLGALWSAGVIERTEAGGLGPRGLAVAPDGSHLAVACYFAGEVVLADPRTGKTLGRVAIGPKHEPTLLRRGELYFHDGRLCYQGWLSCATCHPGARADGLNWDLLNDGIGNPKNTKSLLWSHKTPPAMATGIRKGMDVAAAAGFRFILFRQPEEDQLQAVRAYLMNLQPARSPYRNADGSLTAQALRGQAIFQSAEAGCSSCHPPKLYTDLTRYDVGTKNHLDRVSEFDTPTLVELWRTGPYLHDGSARTLTDLLTTRNKAGRHGNTGHLTKEQLQDLVAFLLSL